MARVKKARPERCIRVNAIGTSWHEDDVAQAVAARPDALVLPKLEHADDLVDLDHALADLEDEARVARSCIALHVQLENAEALMEAFPIACAARELPRVASFIFGAEDYAASVGARRSRAGAEVLMARSLVVAAAAVARVAAIDQVFIEYKDAVGLASDSRAGRDLGYTGKQIIHPDQIAPVHEVFTPSPREVADAREMLAAVEVAAIGEGGTIGHKGRMIDRPVVEQARRVVAMAEALQL
jgi:citrate lyase beta subunit